MPEPAMQANPEVEAAWQEYLAETKQEEELYASTVDNAGILRNESVSHAIDVYHAAVAEADRIYGEAQTHAWQSYHAATAEARSRRDDRTTAARHSLTMDQVITSIARTEADTAWGPIEPESADV
jgi:hypothetical protein